MTQRTSPIFLCGLALVALGACVDKGGDDDTGAADSGAATGDGAVDCVDADGDGFGEGADSAGTDCDDNDAALAADCGGAGTGTAELTFSLHMDPRQEGDWLATGCIQGAEENTIGCDPEDMETLVIMLCQASDPTCVSPALIRAVTAAENEEQILVQDSYGADVRVSDLPAGDWLVMLMIDGAGSVVNGAAWTDDFGNTEADWGGVASVGDILLTAPHDEATSDYNPTPTAWAVTLVDGEAANIGEDPPRHSNSDAYGSVWLSHFHQ